MFYEYSPYKPDGTPEQEPGEDDDNKEDTQRESQSNTQTSTSTENATSSSRSPLSSNTGLAAQWLVFATSDLAKILNSRSGLIDWAYIHAEISLL